jgi:hypothetical protein
MAKFDDLVEFGDCNFLKNATFKESDFQVDTTFNNTTFLEPAEFSGSNFLGFADFGGSKFLYDADFSDSIFSGPADFSRTAFRDRVNFYNTQFKKNVHFQSSQINTINLTRAGYDWLYLKWDCVNHLEFDDAAYQNLINNYKRLQWLTDSSDCSSTYLKEIIRVAPDDSHKWIIDGILSMVAGTNSSNSSHKG